MENKYTLNISLHVVEHLGINLYSSLPAVLSEVVANAYDADAGNISIDIDKDKNIYIQDDGIGMSEDDINDKYLRVGYKRRNEVPSTAKGRKVMGRKGIGKLSLFSIADKITIISKRKDTKVCGLIMDVNTIKKCAKNNKKYHPQEINESTLKDCNISETGTIIQLEKLQKERIVQAPLKKALARRFSCIDDDFKISLNKETISYLDREYFTQLEYCWILGKEQDIPQKINSTLQTIPQDEKEIIHIEDDSIKISGWIGTVNSHKKEDNILPLVIRKKIAHENLLDIIGVNQVGASYIVGEIYADYLDSDTDIDIATTNRQGIIEDDPRFKAMTTFLHEQIKKIAGQWSKKRAKEGSAKIIDKYKGVKEWYDNLDNNNKKKADAVLGRIHTIRADANEEKEFVKAGVLAVEKSKTLNLFEDLDTITPESLKTISELLKNYETWEASSYYEITSKRLKVIKELERMINEEKLEKAFQEYIYEHLWLLDPGFERPTENEEMEKSLKKIAEETDVSVSLTEEEEKARVDILYRYSGAEHVIVELKRENVFVDHHKLITQIDKYREGLERILQAKSANNKIEGNVRVLVLIGSDAYRKLQNNSLFSADMKTRNCDVLTYQHLLANSRKRYQSYLDKQKEAGKILDTIVKINQM